MTQSDNPSNLARASALLAEGRLSEAAALASQVLARMPDDPAALHLMGLVELRAHNLPAAHRHFERAAQVAPEDPDAAAILGHVCLQRQMPAAAIDALERAASGYGRWIISQSGSEAARAQIPNVQRRRLNILMQLASLHGPDGNWQRAASRATEAIELCRILNEERHDNDCVNMKADADMVHEIITLRSGTTFPSDATQWRDDWERSAASIIASAGAILRDASLGIVFFHVDAGDRHPFLQGSPTVHLEVGYGETLALACRAARVASPGARILLLTNEHTAIGAADVDAVAHLPLDRDLMMYSRMRAYRAAVLSGILTGPTLFLDTDISLRKDFAQLFDGSFDIGMTYRAMLSQSHMPLNEGVILADLQRRSSVASGFGQWLALYDWMATLSCTAQRYGFDIRRWRGGQLSLAAFADWKVPPHAPEARDINGVRCRFFPCDNFNFAVKSSSAETLASMNDKWAFHFKGAQAKEKMRLIASTLAVQSTIPSAS